MLVPSACLLQAAHLAFSSHPPAGAGLLAYIGLGPGQEFIPYFFGLLGVAAAAVVAAVQWPFLALLRRFSRGRLPPQRQGERDDPRGGEAG